MTAPHYRAEHLPAPGAWVERAACAELGPRDDIWFSETPGGGGTVAKKQAQAICGRCDVQAACAAYALEHNPAGTWAGLTWHDRKQMRGDA